MEKSERLLPQETLVKAAENVVRYFILKNEKDGKKEVSTARIAEKAKVAETTIRGARNGYLHNISLEKVMLMTQNLAGHDNCNPKDIKKISEVDLNKSKETVLNQFNHLLYYTKPEVDLEKCLNNYTKMKIFLLTHSGSPVKRDAIVKQLGQQAEDDLNELIDLKLISESGGHVKGNLEQHTLLPKDLAIKLTRLGASNFCRRSYHKGENWHSYQAARVNTTFIRLWRKRCQDLFEEFYELTKRPEFSGDYYFYHTAMADKYFEGKNNLENTKGEI